MDDASIGPERIELDELLTLAMETWQAGLRVSCPATVVDYDRTAGTVSVSLPIDNLLPDGEGGFVREPYPNLRDVPIGWPRCRQFAITFPLVAGDTGQLVICERSISAWRAGTAGHPGDVGMHTLDGSVFYPGLGDEAHPPKKADASNMVIGSETADESRIEIKPSGGGLLGHGASKGIARAGDDLSASSAFKTWAAAVDSGIATNTPPPTPFATIAGLAGGMGTVHGSSANWKAVD